jgi:hypothetical protein
MQLADFITEQLSSLHSDISHDWPEETKGREI